MKPLSLRMQFFLSPRVIALTLTSAMAVFVAVMLFGVYQVDLFAERFTGFEALEKFYQKWFLEKYLKTAFSGAFSVIGLSWLIVTKSAKRVERAYGM